VLILQHEHETKRRKHISTVPLIRLCLGNCRVFAGIKFDECQRECETDPHALLLFPGEGSVVLDDPEMMQKVQELRTAGAVGNSGVPNRVLLVIDGTWKQAKKILSLNPWIAELSAAGRMQKVCLGRLRSIYHEIRKEPREGFASTLEATARALVFIEPDVLQADSVGEEAAAEIEGTVEGNKVSDTLLRPFERMIRMQVTYKDDALANRAAESAATGVENMSISVGSSISGGDKRAKARARKVAQDLADGKCSVGNQEVEGGAAGAAGAAGGSACADQEASSAKGVDAQGRELVVLPAFKQGQDPNQKPETSEAVEVITVWQVQQLERMRADQDPKLRAGQEKEGQGGARKDEESQAADGEAQREGAQEMAKELGVGTNACWHRDFQLCVVHRSVSNEKSLRNWGQVLRCTYNEANQLCQIANKQQRRKRGWRLSVHKAGE
jgi:DTW domain-containing protein YfiP